MGLIKFVKDLITSRQIEGKIHSCFKKIGAPCPENDSLNSSVRKVYSAIESAEEFNKTNPYAISFIPVKKFYRKIYLFEEEMESQCFNSKYSK
ncbi:Uncharacterised protein [uncultured archaeon]|nr:Uncharacterised protein [uncultured archaeon]